MNGASDNMWRADVLRRVGEMQRAIGRIEGAVLGDDKAGQEGLVKRVVTLEKKEQALSNKYYVAVGIGTTIGLFFTVIKDWAIVHL